MAEEEVADFLKQEQGLSLEPTTLVARLPVKAV
jgi:hypothetical protein